MWFKSKSSIGDKYVGKGNLVRMTTSLLNENPDLRFFAKRYAEFQDESSRNTIPNLQPMFDGTKQDNVMLLAVVMSRINNIFEVSDKQFMRNSWKQPHGFSAGAAKVMESERLNYVEWQFTYQLAAYVLVKLYEMNSLDEAKELISSNYKVLCSGELLNPSKN